MPLSLRRVLRNVMALIYFGVVISGCSSLPLHGQLPNGISLDRIATVSAATPLSWHPGGKTIALVHTDLQLFDIASARNITTGIVPTAVGWSPDGKLLAVASDKRSGSVLRLLDQQGSEVGAVEIPGLVTCLAWRSAREVVATAIVLERYSFGSHLTLTLYRWDGVDAPSATVLHEVTLMPASARRSPESFRSILDFALSPLGDEIAYVTWVDPPEFPPYLKLFVYNLESGSKRQVATAQITAGHPQYSADGEQILFGDGIGLLRWLDLWSDTATPTTLSGRTAEISPQGRHMLVDGRLLVDGSEIARFSSNSTGVFAPDGSRFLLRNGQDLYLVTGLPVESVAGLSTAANERLIILRRWRSEGLISNREYSEARKEVQRQ